MVINIKKFHEQFKKEYKFLYDHDNVAGYDEAVTAFDEFIKIPANGKFVGEFADYRKDIIVSDREAAAFMFALETLS